MTGLLQNLRSLVHPMLVHFPIALLFASVALDWLGWAARRPSLCRAGFYTLLLGTAGAGLAALSGPDHAIGDSVVQSLLVWHQSFALMTVALAVALLVIRWAAPRGIGGWWSVGYLASTLLLLVVLSLTGYYGGELTYHQGVGVATSPAVVSGIAGAGEGGVSGVPVKPLVALLGLFSMSVLGGWIVLGRVATQGYFAQWWQAFRRDNGASNHGNGAIWTLWWAAEPAPGTAPPTNLPADDHGARRVSAPPASASPTAL